MINNKHISKIIIAIMSVAVILCILAVTFSDKLEDILGDRTVKMEYETELFDTDEIISINIDMDEEEWTKMLENATSEEYYVCDVTVNGKTFKNVAIRPKGNTSLSSIAMNPDTDRYSFKLEFDHFVEGQTCWGLDKLILNNDYADATNMKEAIVYDMFNYIGADASLYNYAKVSLNGEYWGVYLALEAVEKSFMLRNFGTQDGELYKPDSMEIGGGNKDSSSGGGPGGGFPGGGERPEGMP
ncbi:MAG: CotH kinase family protein, partial [Lachnospiraceae bacterium]|nr:CotH kinase family protein [Lachnospiraceae bacterium]